jgi:hypothetical protein
MATYRALELASITRFTSRWVPAQTVTLPQEIFNKMTKHNHEHSKIGVSLVLSVFTLAMLAGCEPSRPETSEVSGRITFEGKPVPQGRILFWPSQGRPAMAEIQPDGTYELTTFSDSDGAMIGKHRVTIKATRVHFPTGNKMKSVVQWLVPQRYENFDKSPLTAEVSAGKNTINFDLPN